MRAERMQEMGSANLKMRLIMHLRICCRYLEGPMRLECLSHLQISDGRVCELHDTLSVYASNGYFRVLYEIFHVGNDVFWKDRCVGGRYDRY